ncbi:type IV secretory system conjugative DNA transfer family protein [Dysgonomonas sp. ZJ279]|uniref:type IV secretory system conjugative DNA transfer family protein n=1 Tax=Dysgonomonas sp. ZJ279 TaxID=2709796 RepID=UPI002103756E|nr:type IV secretory system conjugative DNA transfer family protein [Dysgonomonas sp. ZJ279]
MPVFGIGAIIYYYIRKKRKRKPKAPKFKSLPHAVQLETKTGPIILNNCFRGIFVLGAAGSGKSESIAISLLNQFIIKEFAGVVYDFKFPTLANDVQSFIELNRSNVRHFYLNFNNPLQSHRVNAIHPKYLPNTSYAREYAQAIISNLMKESIRKPDYWSRSATDLLTACIWYLKEEHPEICDLPHVLAMITSNDEKLLEILQKNTTTAQMTISIYNAMQRGADNQVSGVIGTLQGVVAQINTPELMYIFGADDFSLDVNDPHNPIVLTVGSYPTLATTLAPLCSLVITVTTKLMNQPNKKESFVLLDEAPTVYIPNIEVLPNTGRSNKIATVIMCQDLSQLRDGYGKEKADVLFSACNNHFYGRVASSYTSEVLSKQFGKEDKTFISTSKGSSQGASFSKSSSQSESVQERDAIKPAEFLNLEVGQFAGIAVESNVNMFMKRFLPINRKSVSSLPFLNNGHQDDIYTYYRNVRADIDHLLM